MEAQIKHEWESMVALYRAAAEALGFRLLDRSVHDWGSSQYACADYLMDDVCTFLDFSGMIVHGKPPKGVAVGFSGVAFRTWLATSPHPREIVTFGEPEPKPPVRGFSALLAQRVLAPLAYRLAGEHRPLPLRGPGDLQAILASHRAKVARAGARPFTFGDKALDERFKLTEEREERAEEQL